jgi:hypothetical protein
MYILGASKSTDEIPCPVPKEVDDKIVFFGPCKKRLRDHFYGDYLSENDSGEVLATRSIYLIGINASNARKPRKIVWAGKVKKFLTFERAYKIYSKSKRFQKVMNATESPIHIKPMYKDGHFIGYKHRKELHKESWVSDILKPKARKHNALVRKIGNELILVDPSKRKTVFTRDCCFVCENIFFAKGKGIDIDDVILDILKDEQKKPEISSYALFGKSGDRANGLRGSWLEIKKNQEKLIKHIMKKAKEINARSSKNLESPKNKSRC